MSLPDPGPHRTRRRTTLIVNPAARGYSASRTQRIVRLLDGHTDLEEMHTKAPGHAAELAAGAVENGVDLVLVLGGDGTVNEAANSLAGTSTALGILPGGEANVLARSIGIPRDPVEAARFALDPRTATRPFPLGSVDGHYFACNCGVGFDAAVVRGVEANGKAKSRWGDWFFLWTGLRLFFTGAYDRRTPHLQLAWGEGLEHGRDRCFLAIVQNVSPYTYFGSRPIRICPDAQPGRGLDCCALDTMATGTVLAVLASAFGRARHADRPHVEYLRNQQRIRIRSDIPMPVQVDGEYLGERAEVSIQPAPVSLRLIH